MRRWLKALEKPKTTRACFGVFTGRKGIQDLQSIEVWSPVIYDWIHHTVAQFKLLSLLVFHYITLFIRKHPGRSETPTHNFIKIAGCHHNLWPLPETSHGDCNTCRVLTSWGGLYFLGWMSPQGASWWSSILWNGSLLVARVNDLRRGPGIGKGWASTRFRQKGLRWPLSKSIWLCHCLCWLCKRKKSPRHFSSWEVQSHWCDTSRAVNSTCTTASIFYMITYKMSSSSATSTERYAPRRGGSETAATFNKMRRLEVLMKSSSGHHTERVLSRVNNISTFFNESNRKWKNNLLVSQPFGQHENHG